MKNCNCNEKKRFDINSPSKNTTYPNRYWGTVEYCEHEKQNDEKQGFILTESNKDLVIL